MHLTELKADLLQRKSLQVHVSAIDENVKALTPIADKLKALLKGLTLYTVYSPKASRKAKSIPVIVGYTFDEDVDIPDAFHNLLKGIQQYCRFDLIDQIGDVTAMKAGQTYKASLSSILKPYTGKRSGGVKRASWIGEYTDKVEAIMNGEIECSLDMLAKYKGLFSMRYQYHIDGIDVDLLATADITKRFEDVMQRFDEFISKAQAKAKANVKRQVAKRNVAHKPKPKPKTKPKAKAK